MNVLFAASTACALRWPYTAAKKYEAEKVKSVQVGIVKRQQRAGFRKVLGKWWYGLFSIFSIVWLAKIS